jgi:hypothetical protein
LPRRVLPAQPCGGGCNGSAVVLAVPAGRSAPARHKDKASVTASARPRVSNGAVTPYCWSVPAPTAVTGSCPRGRKSLREGAQSTNIRARPARHSVHRPDACTGPSYPLRRPAWSDPAYHTLARPRRGPSSCHPRRVASEATSPPPVLTGAFLARGCGPSLLLQGGVYAHPAQAHPPTPPRSPARMRAGASTGMVVSSHGFSLIAREGDKPWPPYDKVELANQPAQGSPARSAGRQILQIPLLWIVLAAPGSARKQHHR